MCVCVEQWKARIYLSVFRLSIFHFPSRLVNSFS